VAFKCSLPRLSALACCGSLVGLLRVFFPLHREMHWALKYCQGCSTSAKKRDVQNARILFLEKSERRKWRGEVKLRNNEQVVSIKEILR